MGSGQTNNSQVWPSASFQPAELNKQAMPETLVFATPTHIMYAVVLRNTSCSQHLCDNPDELRMLHDKASITGEQSTREDELAALLSNYSRVQLYESDQVETMV